MKKLSYILLFIVLSTNLIADEASTLTIRMWDNSDFTIVFNKEIYKKPSSRFVLNDIQPGRHKIRILKHFSSPYPYTEIVYYGYIDIPSKSKITTKINQSNNLKIINIVPIGSSQNIKNEDNSLEEGGNSLNFMNNHQFIELKTAIKNCHFESEKIHLAKEALKTHSLLTNHITELIQLFNFETTKIDFAKYAYQYTINTDDYSSIYKNFAFDSSIEELKKYITHYNRL